MRKPQTSIFCHRPGLDTRLVDEEAFVITRTTIKHLNATAVFVWLLLAEPSTRLDLLAALKKTYPDVPWQRLSADLGRLLNELLESNLIHAVEPGTGPHRRTKNC